MQNHPDDALARAILETVSLPLLALDADLRVETANDAFLQRFRVSGDETVGRLVYDLGNGQWDIPELRRLLGEILPEKTTVTDYRVDHDFERIGRRIMLLGARRIARPGRPDLILLAISDETERQALRAELIGRVELADKLIDSVREGRLILDPDLRVHSASGSFYETFGVEPGETVGRPVYDLGNGQWDIPDLRKLLEDVLPRQQSFDDYEVTHVFEDIGERVMVPNGRRLDHMPLILLAIRDITEHRESAARLKEVAVAAHVGVFEFDARADTLYWSPELRDILGYPQDEPPPRTLVPDFVHPGDRDALARLGERVMDPGGDGLIDHEHRIVRPDGEIRWLQMHGKVEFATAAGQPRPATMRGVILDVTERKMAEERLRESEARQAFLLDLADALRTPADPSTVTATATRLIGERLNATRAYYVTWPPGEDSGVVSPDYAVPGVPSLAGRYPVDVFRSAYDALAGGGTWVVADVAVSGGLDPAERDHYLGLGVVAWVDVPLVKDGELRAALCVVQDEPRDWKPDEIALIEAVAERCWAAVERARAEAALRGSETRFRRIAEANLIGIGFGTSRGRITYVNDEMLRMMGRTRAEFEAGEIDWTHAIAPEDREGTAERVEALRRDGAVAGFEQSFLRPDGERTRFVAASAMTMPGEDLHVTLALDVTERARAEDRQQILMAELDHRVKNILAVVQSIARQSLGRGEAVGPDAAERLIGRIDALARSHTLLARSRWEGARFRDLVESAVAPYRGEDAARIAVEGPDLKVTPKAAQTLTLALHELVTNAVKYGALSRAEGHVSASWHVAGDAEARHLVLIWRNGAGRRSPRRRPAGASARS